MPAFAARRLLLVQRQQDTLTLVGQEGAPALKRVLWYAERNRIPYRWLDPAARTDEEEIRVFLSITRALVRESHGISSGIKRKACRTTCIES